MAVKDFITPVGEKFNYLTIVDEAPFRGQRRHVRVKCDCGTEKDLPLTDVKCGAVKSCGCIRKLKNPVPEIGTRFGKLVVTGPFRTEKAQFATCLCDCGKVYEAKSSYLKRGVVKSCGCLVSAPRHGHAVGYKASRTYRIWTGMHIRCKSEDTGRQDWPRYGGRGIRVCERWSKFENFLADMGVPPPGMSLDRYPDVNGNYEPGNCRWSTAKIQANNTSANRIIEFNGESMTLSQWCEKLSIPYPRTYYRLFVANWPTEEALTDPRRDNRDR